MWIWEILLILSFGAIKPGSRAAAGVVYPDCLLTILKFDNRREVEVRVVELSLSEIFLEIICLAYISRTA